ncbi:lysophospholipase [Maritalea mobilis]|uniref:alpha/beta hydrolase n=1 Tax=Maritalea mobilis TaxID=483324 RepID=UPI001C9858C7|nr:alpha/beta fold hydrolase [Maritalea mobilis]MBY6201234.1 lysophospholipase [Maritalea mobilis]
MLRVLVLLVMLATAPVAADPLEITATGPAGRLAGTLERPEGQMLAAALILPGSGPTDRDGNNPLGSFANSYLMLAEALAENGIATARIDKRGIGDSEGDGNDVSLAAYRADTEAWVATLLDVTGADCIWLIGHSEGALLAIDAAHLPDICGLVLLTPPGRPIGALVRDQLAASPVSAPLLPQYDEALEALLSGDGPDPATLHPGLAPLFATEVRGYFRELALFDPAVELAATEQPTLMIHGDADLQVPPSEAAPLAAARPDATVLLLGGLSHMLKTTTPLADSEDIAAYVADNMRTYIDPTLPLHGDLVPAITDFIVTAHD